MEWIVLATFLAAEGAFSILGVRKLRASLASFWERAPAGAVTDLEAAALQRRARNLGFLDDAKMLGQYLAGTGGYAWMRGK